jgi:hypothetical protein
VPCQDKFVMLDDTAHVNYVVAFFDGESPFRLHRSVSENCIEPQIQYPTAASAHRRLRYNPFANRSAREGVIPRVVSCLGIGIQQPDACEWGSAFDVWGPATRSDGTRRSSSSKHEPRRPASPDVVVRRAPLTAIDEQLTTTSGHAAMTKC